MKKTVKKNGILFRILMAAMLVCTFVLIIPATQKVKAATPKPMAVFDEKSSTLTFYYDAKHTAGTNAWELPENSYYNNPWLSIKDKIEHVVIDGSFKGYKPKTLTGWFDGLLNLTDIKGIGNIDTSNVTDMSYMFRYCRSLTSLDLSSFVTSNVQSMNWMFYGCEGLASLNLGSFDTSNVTDMSYMFCFCRSLTSLNLSNFDTFNVTDMSYMFCYCYNLTSLNLSNFDTSNVTNMHGMFEECQRLTGLNLGSFDTSNVTDMSYMFAGCDSLTGLNLKNFKTENVTDMSSMFESCTKITELDLSSFVTTKLQGLSQMFYSCRELKTLNLKGFNTALVESFDYLFFGCKNLMSLDLGSFNTSKATTMANMFAYCSSLTSLDLSGFNTSEVTKMNGLFDGCYGLESINLKGSFKTTKVTDMSYMFAYCSNLASLDLSTFNTTNVENMRCMFREDTGLTSLDLSSFTTGKVTDMFGMFYSCKALTSLDLSSFITGKVTNMDYMFAYCGKLTSLNLSGFDTSNVQNMSYMFECCSGLTSLDLSGFDTSNVKDIFEMFFYCTELKTIYASDLFRLSSLEDKDTRLFYGSNNLVGGKGTKYVYPEMSVAYARIDGGTSAPGYFTAKSAPLTITKQPVSASVNEGTVADFSLTATGTKLTYLWQYKKKGATSWTDWSTKTTAAITVAYDKSRDGMSLRCKLTDGNGKSVYSNTVTLTYKDAGPVVTKQPVNATVNAGTVADFSLTATGTKLTYLWQYKKKGATSWTDWSTKTTAAITVAYDKSRDGMSLRCKLTDGNGKTIYSNVVTLTYKDVPVITEQPSSTKVTAGELAAFSLKATGTKVKYLWQYKKKGATGWTDWTTKTTAAITVAYDKSRDGMGLRCKLTDANGNTVYSKEVTLTYRDVLTITKQPVSATVNAGTIANFSVTATGTKGVIYYQWQYKKKGDTSWTNWTTKTTAAITVAYDKSRDGMSLRCKLTDEVGKTITQNIVCSDTVTLTYKEEGPVITKQPVSTSVKAGELAAFSLKATGNKVTYLWQYKKAGESSWTDWTTKTKADITVAYEKSRDGMSLRCKMTDGNGNISYSDVVTLKYAK